MNYGPIALTSCLCITMDRMHDQRSLNVIPRILTEIQCGFKKNSSTLDHLVRFETFIRDVFVQKQHVLAILFDLGKVYDTTWKNGILSFLWDLGFRDILPIFIDEFLSDQLVKVRVGSTLSELHQQEMVCSSGQHPISCSLQH